MKYNLAFENSAKQELFDAYFYYESQKQGLGEKFLSEVKYQINIIRSFPELFPKFKKDIHKAVLRRFPFIIFYETFRERDLIAILAIYHSSRRPLKFLK